MSDMAAQTTPPLPRAIRAINSVGRRLDQLGIPLSRLTVPAVRKMAKRMAGELADDPAAEQPLELLVDDYRSGPEMSLVGRNIAANMLAGVVANRSRISNYLSSHPEVGATPIQRPIIIVGLPRTGTTFLFNLLAEDSNARPLQVWETMQPVGPDVDPGSSRDPRRKQAKKTFKQLHFALPDISAIHEFSSDGPEECTGLLLNTLKTPFFRGDLPGYRGWLYSLSEQEKDDIYRQYVNQLLICQYQRPVPPGGHWLLKSPSHCFALSSLLRVLPDALVIQTHRDPTKSVASLCSLSAALDRLMYAQVDSASVGTRTLAIASQLAGAALRADDAAETGRITHVAYRDLVKDPMQTVESIYRAANLPLREGLRERLQKAITARSQNRFGKHSYELADFGLTRDRIDNEFSEYLQRFSGLLQDG